MPDVLEGMDQGSVTQSYGDENPGQSDFYQADYFGFTATERFVLPDRKSYLDLKVLNEGERRRYTNESNREIKLARGTGDAALRMRPGDDKYLLLKTSIVGWNLHRNGQPVPFNSQMLDQFLNTADPAIIDRIEKRVRQLNPWLLSEMTVEQIDEEIKSLEEMKVVKLREEEGNDASSSK